MTRHFIHAKRSFPRPRARHPKAKGRRKNDPSQQDSSSILLFIFIPLCAIVFTMFLSSSAFSLSAAWVFAVTLSSTLIPPVSGESCIEICERSVSVILVSCIPGTTRSTSTTSSRSSSSCKREMICLDRLKCWQ